MWASRVCNLRGVAAMGGTPGSGEKSAAVFGVGACRNCRLDVRAFPVYLCPPAEPHLVKYKHGHVFDDDSLHRRHVTGAHPVLGGAALEGLCL